MIRLSSSRRFDMKSCLLHRVTKLAKLQLGPITVMKVVQQHNNTNSRKDKKRNFSMAAWTTGELKKAI